MPDITLMVLVAALMAGGAVMVAVIVVAVFAHQHAGRRRNALRRACMARGLSYSPVTRDADALHLPATFLFGRGHTRQVEMVVQGSDERGEVNFVDFGYVSGYLRHRFHASQTVALFDVSNSSLGGFELRPTDSLNVLGLAGGADDIDFPGDPAFSAAYLLRGWQEPWVREVFTSPVRAYFQRNAGWCVECDGEQLCVYCSGMQVDASNLEPFMAQTREIHDLILSGGEGLQGSLAW